jgi:hypothetical protein
MVKKITNLKLKPRNRAVLSLLLSAGLMILLNFPAAAYITSLSNLPDPFDNQVADQSSYIQVILTSGTSAFPDRGGFVTTKWDMAVDLFDPAGAFVRR